MISLLTRKLATMVSQVWLMRRASDCHFSLGASACSFCIVVPDSRALFFACTLSSSSDHFFGSFVLNNFFLKEGPISEKILRDRRPRGLHLRRAPSRHSLKILKLLRFVVSTFFMWNLVLVPTSIFALVLLFISAHQVCICRTIVIISGRSELGGGFYL